MPDTETYPEAPTEPVEVTPVEGAATPTYETPEGFELVAIDPVQKNVRDSAQRLHQVRVGALDPVALGDEVSANSELYQGQRESLENTRYRSSGSAPAATPARGGGASVTDSAVLELADRIDALEARIDALEYPDGNNTSRVPAAIPES